MVGGLCDVSRFRSEDFRYHIYIHQLPNGNTIDPEF